jgi:hypothetical protein
MTLLNGTNSPDPPINLKWLLNPSEFWTAATTRRARANVIAGSTSEACRGLFNYLRRSNAALSDNSIQTTVKECRRFFHRHAAIE